MSLEFKDPPKTSAGEQATEARSPDSLGPFAGKANGYYHAETAKQTIDVTFAGQIELPEASVISRVFDADYYRREYPDLDFTRTTPMSHFIEVGWREGRNPNAFFDTVSYMLQYRDIDRANVNPYYHYLLHGAAEGRHAESSVTPSIRARLLFGRAFVDWVTTLTPHFDMDFYRRQFSHPIHARVNLVAHYAYRGWREGKQPSPDFDLDWIARHPGISRYMVNPLLVQIKARDEGFDTRLIQDPAARVVADEQSLPTEETAAEPSDDQAQLRLVATEFDRTFYLTTNPDVAQAGIDPLEHFFYTGWREGRSPNSTFDTGYYNASLQGTSYAGQNPFWHYLAIGRAEGRPPISPPSQADQNSASSDTRSVVRAEFDPLYYLATYPDVAEAGIDPLDHYCYTGWKEGRNPNDRFDSRYYLDGNEDVKLAQINPFWHYLVCGKAEGRLARRPGGYKRAIVDAASVPSERAPINPAPDETEIPEKDFIALLRKNLKGRDKGLVVSLSHDCYPTVIGGTQIFIADEQKKFNETDYAYLHLSPQLARLTLAPPSDRFLTRVVVDGEYLGLVELEALTRYFQSKRRIKVPDTLFVVHCALGFNIDDVTRLHSALCPIRSVYWLHDYSSLCPGFNLLRNDVEYCGAPAVDSLACRVCVYGKERADHLSRIAALFKSCNFDVLSPSQFTLDLWLRSTDAQYRTAGVHPHWRLEPQQDLEDPLKDDEPLSVAFLGYAAANKGWPIFTEIVQRLEADSRFRFFHLASRNVATLSKVEFVRTEVTPDNRQAALASLSENKIRVLLLLSPWPETFSFVAHEAIAAGAFVFCLEDSGNVAEIVRRDDVGKVFADVDGMVEFLQSGYAERYVRERLGSRRKYVVQNSGTTATHVLGQQDLLQQDLLQQDLLQRVR